MLGAPPGHFPATIEFSSSSSAFAASVVLYKGSTPLWFALVAVIGPISVTSARPRSSDKTLTATLLPPNRSSRVSIASRISVMLPLGKASSILRAIWGTCTNCSAWFSEATPRLTGWVCGRFFIRYSVSKASLLGKQPSPGNVEVGYTTTPLEYKFAITSLGISVKFLTTKN